MVILRWPRWGAAGVLAACLTGGFYLLSQETLIEKFLFSGGEYGTITSLQMRDLIWTRAIVQINAFPLTGIGMGTFAQVSRALYPAFVFSAGEVPHAHNLFLQIAVDLGLPGLAAWLVMAWVIARSAWQVYRAGRRAAGWLAGLGAGLLAVQVALVIHGVVDAATWGTRPAVMVWGIWGLALAGREFIARLTAEGLREK
jgi:putative inorganic carbon (HCO3(-)) transporter